MTTMVSFRHPMRPLIFRMSCDSWNCPRGGSTDWLGLAANRSRCRSFAASPQVTFGFLPWVDLTPTTPTSAASMDGPCRISGSAGPAWKCNGERCGWSTTADNKTGSTSSFAGSGSSTAPTASWTCFHGHGPWGFSIDCGNRANPCFPPVFLCCWPARSLWRHILDYNPKTWSMPGFQRMTRGTPAIHLDCRCGSSYCEQRLNQVCDDSTLDGATKSSNEN